MMFFLLFLFTALMTSAHGHITSGPGYLFSTGIKSPQKDLQANGRAKRDNVPQYNPVNFDDAWKKVSEEIDSKLKAFFEDKVLKDSRGIKNPRKYFLQDIGEKSGKPNWEKTTIPSYPAIPNPTGDVTPFEQDKFTEGMGKDLEPAMKTMNISNSIIIGAATVMYVISIIVLALVIVLCKCLYKAICRSKSMPKTFRAY